MKYDSELERCLHEKLINNCGPDKTIKQNEILKILGIFYHIQKNKRMIIIKELEKKGLIKRIDKFKILVIVK